MVVEELFEYRGAVHVHTTHSDGFWEPAAVLGAARRAGVHFLTITDHDSLAALDDPGAGWHDGLLVIVGNEISPPENHYLTFGLSHTPDPASPPVVYVQEVTASGGFGFAAHPFDRGNRVLRIKGYPWTAGFELPFEGIEIWNLSAHIVGGAHNFWRLLVALACPGLYLRSPGADVLALWDRLGAQRHVPGIGGVDAHGWEGWLGRSGILLLDYRAMFRTLQTRVILPQPFSGDAEADTEAVLQALRAGRSYVCNARLGDPQGFLFTARDGRHVYHMGSELSVRGGLRLSAVLPRPADVRLLRDGQIIARQRTAHLRAVVDEPGVYRIEAWRRGLVGPQAWVLSNPIYVRG